jgi:molybdate transport system substrate-binding protein
MIRRLPHAAALLISWLASNGGTHFRRNQTLAIRAFTLAITVLVIFGGLARAEDARQTHDLTIGAPPTLKAALDSVLPLFEREYAAKVHVVYRPSRLLRWQIEHGTAIDVFLSESADEVHSLSQKRLTETGETIYAETSLVVVTAATSEPLGVSFRDALPSRSIRIAVADPSQSPLGDLTARMLTRIDPAYKHHCHLVYAPESTGIVKLLAAGAADVGIVYRADAINSGNLRIVEEMPAGRHVTAHFSEAVISTCRAHGCGLAHQFVHFMMTPLIQKLLVQHGFDEGISHGF